MIYPEAKVLVSKNNDQKISPISLLPYGMISNKKGMTEKKKILNPKKRKTLLNEAHK